VNYKYGNFEIHHLTKPEDMAGKMVPFEPCWEVQSFIDGEQRFLQWDDCEDVVTSTTKEY